MQRLAVNPWDWGLAFQMSQGEIVEGATRTLRCSGQVAVVPDAEAEMGIRTVAEGDIRGQMEAALANVDAVLAEAGMNRSNLVSLRFFTTEMEGFLENYDVYAGWISEAGIMPPQSLIGVACLASPKWMIEVEVEAAA